MNHNRILQRLSCVEINNYDFIKMLGTGSYSEVFQGLNKKDGTQTAIKVIDKVFLAKQNKSHQIYLEQEALASIDHPGIIKCYATYESSSKLYLSIELMSEGTFRDYIKENKLSLDEIKSYVTQILVILEQIHAKGIVHRDLKPENLMMTKSKFLKLIDFGAIMMYKGDKASKEASHIQHCRKSSFVGTSHYISPELLDMNICGPQSDLWALGCITYELLKGRTPFQDDVEYLMFKKISEDEPDYQDLSEDAIDFIKQLLAKDPSNRLSKEIENECRYSSLRQHPFLSSVDVEKLWIEQIPFQRKTAQKAYTSISNGKQVLFSGIVDKQSGVLLFTKYTPRKMQLIQGHFQRELIYYNPYSKKSRTISLGNAMCEQHGQNGFIIQSDNKKYHFKEREHPIEQWVEQINQAIIFNKQFEI